MGGDNKFQHVDGGESLEYQLFPAGEEVHLSDLGRHEMLSAAQINANLEIDGTGKCIPTHEHKFVFNKSPVLEHTTHIATPNAASDLPPHDHVVGRDTSKIDSNFGQVAGSVAEFSVGTLATVGGPFSGLAGFAITPAGLYLVDDAIERLGRNSVQSYQDSSTVHNVVGPRHLPDGTEVKPCTAGAKPQPVKGILGQ